MTRPRSEPEPQHHAPNCAVGVPFLRALPDAALAELGRRMHHREVDRGTVLALAGEPVDHLIVVARGRFQVTQAAAHGREQVTRVLEPGDFLGELALFTPVRHDGTVMAIEPGTVCALPREAVQTLLADYPSVAVSLVEALARRLTQAEATIASLGLRDVEARLAGALLRLMPDDAPVEPEVRVQVPGTWAELAARLGTTPESLSRRLDALTRRGVIARERGRIVVIRDVAVLRMIAET